MIPTNKEINDQIDAAIDIMNNGSSKCNGMSYEEGVRTALEWILTGQDKPIEDEETN